MEPTEDHIREAIAVFQLAKAKCETNERAVRMAVEAVFKMLPRQMSALHKSFYGE